MKYIRTKDVIGRAGNDTKKYDWIGSTQILGVADTIEELCDEFVSVFKDLTPELLEPKFVSPREPLSVSWKNRLEEEHLFKDNVVYGAIWTDKGLIYVAKMNEKGELELL